MARPPTCRTTAIGATSPTPCAPPVVSGRSCPSTCSRSPSTTSSASPPRRHDVSRPHVVIVGAGFGGLDCAKQLVNEPVDVTIVDRHNFHTFQPLLYQVATAGLASSDVAYPVRGLFQDAANVRFRTGEVDGVDWDAARLHLTDGTTLPFDELVLA